MILKKKRCEFKSHWRDFFFFWFTLLFNCHRITRFYDALLLNNETNPLNNNNNNGVDVGNNKIAHSIKKTLLYRWTNEKEIKIMKNVKFNNKICWVRMMKKDKSLVARVWWSERENIYVNEALIRKKNPGGKSRVENIEDCCRACV